MVGGPSEEELTRWEISRLHIDHLNTLVQREIAAGSTLRATHLSERARKRAWSLFNEMIAAGARKPAGYAEPSRGLRGPSGDLPE